jgi:hypothetical protein
MKKIPLPHTIDAAITYAMVGLMRKHKTTDILEADEVLRDIYDMFDGVTEGQAEDIFHELCDCGFLAIDPLTSRVHTTQELNTKQEIFFVLFRPKDAEAGSHWTIHNYHVTEATAKSSKERFDAGPRRAFQSRIVRAVFDTEGEEAGD